MQVGDDEVGRERHRALERFLRALGDLDFMSKARDHAGEPLANGLLVVDYQDPISTRCHCASGAAA
jgi:hypothetical protein